MASVTPLDRPTSKQLEGDEAPEVARSTCNNITDREMGGGRDVPPLVANRESYVVQFDGKDDPWNPRSMSSTSKFWISMIVCYGTFVATLNSAMFAAGSSQASHDFAVVVEVGKIGTSLYVLGFALGPLIWAPGSELVGRKWPLLVGMFGCSVFTIASAVAKDVQTLIITRFFAGVFGASPLVVVPGVLSDMYEGVYRGTAISLYALAVFVGPLAAPFIGAFITESNLRWRWTLYLPALLGFVDVVLIVFLVSESYTPVALARKAADLRRRTGNWAIHAEYERMEVNTQELVSKYLIRPLRILITEWVVLIVTLYMSFVYGLVYALLEAYPFIFQKVHGMSAGVSGLPFIALIIGVTLGVYFAVYCQRRSYRTARSVVAPEERLLPVMIGAPIFALGLFWFSWTSFTSSVHWMVPTASGLVTGFGVLSVFLPCFNYLVDIVPLSITASTVAANIILRSTVAACFPLFSVHMFRTLGIQWAGTLLACLATAMVPIPFLFRAYGAQIRGRSKLLSDR